MGEGVRGICSTQRESDKMHKSENDEIETREDTKQFVTEKFR